MAARAKPPAKHKVAKKTANKHSAARSAEPVLDEAQLRIRQQAFVEAYLANGFNATRAAVTAGYSERSARSIGSENLTKPDIRAAIDKRLKEMAMGADEVLARLTDMAGADMADFLTASGRGVKLDLKKAAGAGKLRLVKKFSKTKQGTSIELYDAQAALVQLGRHHGLFLDKLAPTDPTGTKEYGGLTDEERAERVAVLLERARARRAGQSDGDSAQDH